MRRKKKGYFITFEGIEGSGKTTHCKLAAKYIKQKGFKVLLLREPGGTRIGEKIRHILLDRGNINMSVECELLLYNAARIELVKNVIIPALKRGTIVLCDRFVDSTVAYQCFGGRLDRGMAERVNDFASMDLIPKITFLLESDVRRGLRRAGRSDRMELKSIAFHKRVQKGFLTLARENRSRFCIVKECPIEKGRKVIERRLDGLFG